MIKDTYKIVEFKDLYHNYNVYILCCSDGTYYTGITNDLKRRLNMHNAGTASKYTKSRRPVAYVYVESGLTKSEALKREHSIKQLSRAKKQMLIRSDKNEL